jgi:hypothetical protein
MNAEMEWSYWCCDKCGNILPEDAPSSEWEKYPKQRFLLYVCVFCADEIMETSEYGQIVA